MHLLQLVRDIDQLAVECGWVSPLPCPTNRPAELRTCHFARPIVINPRDYWASHRLPLSVPFAISASSFAPALTLRRNGILAMTARQNLLKDRILRAQKCDRVALRDPNIHAARSTTRRASSLHLRMCCSPKTGEIWSIARTNSSAARTRASAASSSPIKARCCGSPNKATNSPSEPEPLVRRGASIGSAIARSLAKHQVPKSIRSASEGPDLENVRISATISSATCPATEATN